MVDINQALVDFSQSEKSNFSAAFLVRIAQLKGSKVNLKQVQ